MTKSVPWALGGLLFSVAPAPLVGCGGRVELDAGGAGAGGSDASTGGNGGTGDSGGSSDCECNDSGSKAEVFAADQVDPLDIRVAEGMLYLCNTAAFQPSSIDPAGSVVRLNLSDGTIGTLAGGLWLPTGPAVDDASVFWADGKKA